MRVTGNRLWLAAGLVVMSVWPGVAIAASSISGTVTFTGKPPALKPLAMDADPACAKKHSGPVPDEMLVLGGGNTMGNIMVYVTKGLPAGKTYPAPKTPVVMDQNGCIYKPHVMGIQVGQPYKILNSDGILHNVHTLPKVNKAFNQAMPATRKEATTQFDKEEAIFHTKCDVHPWMSACVGVFSHPFFSVTGTDGKFTISGLDPGTYEITAWHERLGTQTASITVGANDKKTQDFKFARPREVAFRRTVRMSHPAAVAGPKAHVAHEAHHEELGFWRKYVFSVDHKVIGIQYTVTGLLFLLLRLLSDDADALAARLPGRAAAAHRHPLRRVAHAGRVDAPRVLQRARGDARHHHGLPRRGSPRRRRIREFRAPAPDRSPGHGVPAAQHGELLVLLPRRRDDAGQLLRPRGSRAVRVDLLRAPLRHCGHGPDVVAHRHDLPDHLVAARGGQLHHDHDPAPRQGPHVHAIPVLRVGAVRDGVPPAPGLPAARGRGGHAADGSGGRHELLPPERSRRQRPGRHQCRRRQPAPLAAPVLVPGAPGGLRPDPSRDGHRGRDHREQHAEAPVGLPVDGLLAHLPRLHVVHRVGAPHVHDRHGDGDGGVLPDDHDDHLDPVGRDPDGPDHLAVGRIDPLQHADALRDGLSADVRHRRADRASARLERRGHPAARHLLRHRPLPLRRRAGDDLRALRGDLLLVSRRPPGG